MTAMMLSEELLLLAHDDEPDKPGATLTLDNGLACALLLDLAAEGLVVAKGKAVVGVAGTASHPLLNAALTELLASDEPRPAQHWLTQLPSALGPLRAQVGTSLAERGVLAAERRTALGLVPARPWPEVDPATEHELRARLHRALVYSGEPDAHTALLISLLRAELELRSDAGAVAELDLLAHVDGQVVVLEAKRNNRLASTAKERVRKAQKLALAAKLLRADVVYLATAEATWSQPDTQDVSTAVRDECGDRVEVKLMVGLAPKRAPESPPTEATGRLASGE